MQSVYIFYLFILQIQSILESHHQTGHTHFWPCSLQKFSISFNLCEIIPACKKSVSSISSFLRYSQFLTMPHQKRFNQLLIFVNLYQYAKNEVVSSFINLLWRNAWFKNSAIWMAESILVHISGTTFFPNGNNMKFHYRTNKGKLKTKFFFKLKKPYFWPILGSFPQFLGAKNVFPKNLARTT